MNARAFYNEIDGYCCDWLQSLMDAGLIMPGRIDDRSIADVSPDDLAGFTRCHFFAGIAGWDLALQLAGWPDNRPVWTGSCPCQPLSSAGKKQGHTDKRHLWPEFYRLVEVVRPPVVFGEQVASPLGREWLDAVRLDLEDMGYALGAADLCAAGVGAPHIRQRLWFVAHADEGRSGRDAGTVLGKEGEAGRQVRCLADGAQPCGSDGQLAYADQSGRSGVSGGRKKGAAERSNADALADSLPAGRAEGRAGAGHGSPAGGALDVLEHAEGEQVGLSGRPRKPRSADPWASVEWLPCTDGKARPTQPGIFPLAHGIPARVAKLRAAGNAIVPQAAAAFIQAAM